MRPAWEYGIEKNSLEEEKADGGGRIPALLSATLFPVS